MIIHPGLDASKVPLRVCLKCLVEELGKSAAAICESDCFEVQFSDGKNVHTAMNDRIDPEFADILAPFSPEKLDSEPGTIYGLRADCRLAYFNEGWCAFARENGGPNELWSREYLGANVLEVTPDVLKPYYENLFSRALTGDSSSRRPLHHEYECSSALFYRRFLMSVYRLKDAKGLLVVNSIVVEEAHKRIRVASGKFDRAAYLDANGFITQCAHCRRTQNMKNEGQWDWIPEWVDEMPVETSHSLCRLCFEMYW